MIIKPRPKDHRIVVTAIICITILEGLAIYNGINGMILTAIIGVLAGLAGWSAPQLKLK